MKKKAVIQAGTVIAIAAAFLCLCIWLFAQAGGRKYYTQIDNNKIKEGEARGGVIDLETGGMPYSYTLLAYNENGGAKEITFGASRELREGAFLCLTVAPVRGVIEWSEMQYDELPKAVQNCYINPETNSGSNPESNPENNSDEMKP